MACDIGFDNMLALENTRLLWTYAMLEPRLRLMVLFSMLHPLLSKFVALIAPHFSQSLD